MSNKKRKAPLTRVMLDTLRDHKPTTGIVEKIKKILSTGKREIMMDVKIDLATAKDLLTLNQGNREATLLNIQRYADDMLNGKWKDSVDAFVITSEGFLRNGQKRTMAVKVLNEKGHPFSFVVDIIVGLPPEVGPVLDTGKMRSLADTLKDKGLEHVFALSAAIRTIFYLEEFQRVGKYVNKADIMRNDQIDQWTTQNRKGTALALDLVKKSEAFRSEHKLTIFAPSSLAAIWYLLHKKNADEAEYFMTKLASGADLSVKFITDSNIILLRQILISLDRNPDGRHSSMRQDERYRYLIYAWNASRRKERIVSVSKFKPDFKSITIEKPI